MRPVNVVLIVSLVFGHGATASAQQGSPSGIRVTKKAKTIAVEHQQVDLPRAANSWVAACAGRTTTYSGRGESYWLGGGGSALTHTEPLGANRVVPVVSNLSRANDMLSKHLFVRLNKAQLEAFTGGESLFSVGPNLQPYLVRSVGAQDSTLVRWDGQNLEVMGTAMGECPDLANRPVVVFLERRPQHVLVDTIGDD